jgi:hypothetical protein
MSFVRVIVDTPGENVVMSERTLPPVKRLTNGVTEVSETLAVPELCAPPPIINTTSSIKH